MKAGLITFHAADNCGAVLQAVALQQYICEHLCQCELIDFIPNNAAAKRGGFGVWKRRAAMLRHTLRKDRSWQYSNFRAGNYHLSARTYCGDRSLEASQPQYDILISGSDQILNTTLSGCSESYYLKPWNQGKKISYASSFGRDVLTEDEFRLIREELPKFQHLSVREASAQQILFRELGRKVPLVVDPVFLLSREQWERKKKPVKTPNDYVLVYAMEYSKTMELLIQRQMQNHRVLLLCGGQSARQLPGEKLADCGPGEFLSYVAGAEQIITNSFHGSAFSMIFGKPFWCIAHSTRNARLESLMDSCGHPEWLIYPTSQKQDQADGEACFAQLHDRIALSKAYLQEAIMD